MGTVLREHQKFTTMYAYPAMKHEQMHKRTQTQKDNEAQLADQSNKAYLGGTLLTFLFLAVVTFGHILYMIAMSGVPDAETAAKVKAEPEPKGESSLPGDTGAVKAKNETKAKATAEAKAKAKPQAILKLKP